MTYPHPMDVAAAQDRRADSLEFVCNSCNVTFLIPLDEYEGEYDHADCDCRCEACKLKEGRFVGRLWIEGESA